MTPETALTLVANSQPAFEAMYASADRDSNLLAAGHLLYMCEEIPNLDDTGRTDEALYWLGFVAGSLYSMGIRPEIPPPVRNLAATTITWAHHIHDFLPDLQPRLMERNEKLLFTKPNFAQAQTFEANQAQLRFGNLPPEDAYYYSGVSQGMIWLTGTRPLEFLFDHVSRWND